METSNDGMPETAGSRWVASPNFNERTVGPEGIDVVVLHSTCMPTNEIESVVELFQKPESQVASHYVVGKDGEIVQMVAEKHRAWHAGKCDWNGRTDVNSCSIGIEMMHRDQDPDDDWPEAQMQAMSRLMASIRSRHNVPDENVIFHYECAVPVGRKTDPKGFDRDRLLAMTEEIS